MAGDAGGRAVLDNFDHLRAGRAQHAQVALRKRAQRRARVIEMDLAGKRVMVIGLGVSGLAAARLLAARGARLVMTDLRADLRLSAHDASARICVA